MASSKVKVSPSRRIAFDVLCRVTTAGGFASDLLHTYLDKSIRREDAALATELTLGVLRWQRLLDFLVERLRGKDVSSLDSEVLNSLRVGLYQLRFLDRVPPSAAVNESVELVKISKKASAAPLVNAILRRAAAGHPPIARQRLEDLLPANTPLAEKLGILLSHPDWMVERWLVQFGEEGTQALLEANNRPPRLTCAPPGGQASGSVQSNEIQSALRAAGFQVEPGRWLKSAFDVRGGSIAQTKLFQQGRLAIQDEASQMIPLLLGVEPGDSVLDSCAGQGGKTAMLLRASGEGGLVVSADHQRRNLQALRARLASPSPAALHATALDATMPLPFSLRFRRILIDAPCSGTGTLARHPEIRWRLAPGDLENFHVRQAAMLGHAAACLALGGRLVYATCSLEPEENERVIEEFLATRTDFRVARAAEQLRSFLRDPDAADAFFPGDGFFRTFPPRHQTDGFFAAALHLS